jgi:predicted RNA methylase
VTDSEKWLILTIPGFWKAQQKMLRLRKKRPKMDSISMGASKTLKQHRLGQFMTPSSVADLMCDRISTDPSEWFVLDPACGDGNLLVAAAKRLLEANVPKPEGRLFGFDIDQGMTEKAKAQLSAVLDVEHDNLNIFNDDFLSVLSPTLFTNESHDFLSQINLVLANPPYRKNLELEFFERVDQYFSDKSEMIFLLPLAFVDRVTGIKYEPLDGRPLGVTTGHVIVKHWAGNPFSKSKVVEPLANSSPFTVHTGVKLYAKGEGNPPQTKETVDKKPFSSGTPIEGWLPCLRTGDIQPFAYTTDRLWVNYGDHLAHPKEFSRFKGPHIFIRRVPIWKTKRLAAALCLETVLCAGDVLLIRHSENDQELLKGLCVFLNSQIAADHIFERRPSIRLRDSYPKISGKDLNYLLENYAPADTQLRLLAENYA